MPKLDHQEALRHPRAISFFYVISPALAVSTMIFDLRVKQINRPYIIAVEDDFPSDGISPHSVWVLYPENYEGNLLF
jgi:hypothetical protein